VLVLTTHELEKVRKSLICILLISSVASCNNKQKQQAAEKQEPKRQISPRHRIPDSILLSHFRILDSAARMPAKDAMYHCCLNSVNFMESYTGIEADVESDYFGATGFKKQDLQKWHEWYDKEYGQKNN
jgi:hypothetical protein